MIAEWLDRARDLAVLPVAAALGLKTSPARGASGGSVEGCPSCNAERRHPSRGDRRGAIGVRRDGRGWRCFECDTSGDALDLVAFSECGNRLPELADSGIARVRDWFIGYLSGVATATPVQPRLAPEVEAPKYPPREELEALIEQCRRVDMDSGVSTHVHGRCIDPIRVADMRLAFALPVDADPPAWASRWNDSERRAFSWIDTSHRLIVPLFDERGLMRSVLARCIDPREKQKSLAPVGFARAGVVMACPFGRWLLATGERPDWWPESEELRIVIAEGEMDFATIATTWSDASEFAPAVFGVVNGAWPSDSKIAARIPDHSVVDIATHDDRDGDRYAAQIAESLDGRPIEVRRWKAPQGAAA